MKHLAKLKCRKTHSSFLVPVATEQYLIPVQKSLMLHILSAITVNNG